MGNPMLRSRRRVGWSVAALAAAALAGLGLWAGVLGPEPTWTEIQAAVRGQRWGEAERLLGRWLRSRPGDGSARTLLAGALRAQGREAEALGILERVTPSDRAWGRAQERSARSRWGGARPPRPSGRSGTPRRTIRGR